MNISHLFGRLRNSAASDVAARTISPTAPVAIFLHGLGGSSAKTWSHMLSLCNTDPLLKEVHFDAYEYNTSLWRLPFQLRMPALQELAAGLASEIRIRHQQRREIFLIGHSLGGLVARQYILSEIKKSNEHRVSGVLLFATPNTGASLASIGKALSWNHRHLRQLTIGSDILRVLNDDWVHFDVEALIKVKYISGGADAIVGPSSSSPYIGERNCETLIEHNHRSIITPNRHDDIRYLVLQKFLIGTQPEPQPTAGHKQPDPLFDIYHDAHEPYYFKRTIDDGILNQLAQRPVWLSGPSGVGKTTTLRHLSHASGWKTGQIMLAGYEPDAPEVLLRAMCEQVADFQRSSETLSQDADVPAMIAYFRRQLRLTSGSSTLCLIIEEIPIRSREKLEVFLGYLLSLLLSIESDESVASRFVIAFSSIYDPTEAICEGMVKLREHLQVRHIPQWSLEELEAFIGKLCSATGIDLSPIDATQLAKAACGSPRFVKMVLRKLKLGSTVHLSKAIETVETERV